MAKDTAIEQLRRALVEIVSVTNCHGFPRKVQVDAIRGIATDALKATEILRAPDGPDEGKG